MESYRDWLKVEFESRCKRNASYSLRAFARDLKLFPSHLSDILNGKQGLSRKSALMVVEQMKLVNHDRALFIVMVEAEHSRNPEHRKKAKERLQTLNQLGKSHRLSADTFNLISDWYHFAILDLVNLPDFQPDERWVAKRLGISQAEVAVAVEKLVTLGLLNIEGGRWILGQQFPSVYSNVPSASIRRYHSQLMDKAKKALTEQPLETRDFSSMSIPVDPDDLEEMREDIRIFRRALDQKYKLRPRRRALYALCVQLFPLTSINEDEQSNEAGVVNA